MKKERNFSLDVIRIFALFCVISVHFFLNNGYYNEIIIGKRMYVMTLMRNTFMICVPLFIILTGYLMCNKQLSKDYYKGIIRTIGIYILVSIVCVIYKILFTDYQFNVLNIIFDILGFKAAIYSWYVEMYIGLFLLIPFLNIIYQNLKSQKEKKTLIITISVLTIFPATLNYYHELLPQWWINIYPFIYYFIGCYLKEFGIRISKKKNILLIAVFVIFFGSICYYKNYGLNFMPQSWAEISNVVLSVLIFNLLLNINLTNISNILKKILKNISEAVLGAYLISSIFDDICYKILNSHIHTVGEKLKYYILIVPVVFVCSLIASICINYIYYILVKVCTVFINKIKNKFDKRIKTE